MPSESLKKNRFRSDFPRAGQCLCRKKTFLETSPRPGTKSRSGVKIRPRQPSASLPATAESDGWLAPLGPGLAPKLLWDLDPRLRLRLDRVRPSAVHLLRRIRVGTRRPHPSSWSGGFLTARSGDFLVAVRARRFSYRRSSEQQPDEVRTGDWKSPLLPNTGKSGRGSAGGRPTEFRSEDARRWCGPWNRRIRRCLPAGPSARP